MTVLKMSHFCLKYEKGLSHLALEIWLEHRIGRERLVYKQFLWIRFTSRLMTGWKVPSMPRALEWGLQGQYRLGDSVGNRASYQTQYRGKPSWWSNFQWSAGERLGGGIIICQLRSPHCLPAVTAPAVVSGAAGERRRGTACLQVTLHW